MGRREDNPVMRDLGYVKSDGPRIGPVGIRRSSRPVYDLETLEKVESILFADGAFPPEEDTAKSRLSEVEQLGFVINYDFNKREGYIPPFLVARRQIRDELKNYAARQSLQTEMGLD